MAMNFGKLNFAVGFNRTSAFPLDANSYFEDYASAETAAAGAAEVGSSDSAYYIGQVIIVKDTTKGVGLYQISADKKLVKFGQASSETDLAEKISALETRATNIEGKLILATTEADGFMSKEDKAKLDGIAEGATKVIVDAELTENGTNPVQGKAIKSAIAQIDGDVVALEGRVDAVEGTANAAMPKAGGEFTGKVSSVATADADGATTLVTKGYVDTKLGNKVDVVEGKGLSTNDYDNAAVAEVAKVKDKLDSATFNTYKEETKTRVSGIEGNVSELQDKIKGVTGAMHFKGVLNELPEDKSSYVAGDVIIVNKKEYVLAGDGDAKEWHELGDEGSHLTKATADGYYVAKNTAITGATKCKITYDSKGLVTAGADLTASDIPSLAASKITSETFADARIASASTWNSYGSKITALEGKAGLDKVGTVTGIKMNGSAKTVASDGTVDLGTVITDVSGKQDKLSTTQLSAVNSGITSAKVTTYDGYASKISTLEGKKGLDKVGTVTSVAAGTGLKITGTASTTPTIAIDDAVVFIFDCGSSTENI
jgi:hypothetical protein